MEVRFETLDGQLVEQAVLKEDKKNYPLLKKGVDFMYGYTYNKYCR